MFDSILETPETFTSNTVLARFIDAWGFRLNWAVKGLEDYDLAKDVAGGVMSIEELIYHIEDLSLLCLNAFSENELKRDTSLDALASFRNTLENLEQLKKNVLSTSNEDLAKVEVLGFPIWNMMNGPIADALTHIGQINLLRRMQGNPTLPVSVFLGKPKRSK